MLLPPHCTVALPKQIDSDLCKKKSQILIQFKTKKRCEKDAFLFARQQSLAVSSIYFFFVTQAVRLHLIYVFTFLECNCAIV